MMLANDLKTYYDEVRRYLDCPKDEQDRLCVFYVRRNIVFVNNDSVFLTNFDTRLNS